MINHLLVSAWLPLSLRPMLVSICPPLPLGLSLTHILLPLGLSLTDHSLVLVARDVSGLDTFRWVS